MITKKGQLIKQLISCYAKIKIVSTKRAYKENIFGKLRLELNKGN